MASKEGAWDKTATAPELRLCFEHFGKAPPKKPSFDEDALYALALGVPPVNLKKKRAGKTKRACMKKPAAASSVKKEKAEPKKRTTTPPKLTTPMKGKAAPKPTTPMKTKATAKPSASKRATAIDKDDTSQNPEDLSGEKALPKELDMSWKCVYSRVHHKAKLHANQQGFSEADTKAYLLEQIEKARFSYSKIVD